MTRLAVLPALALALLPVSAAQAFSARGSVEQVQVTGVSGGARVVLLDRRGGSVQSKRADSLGGALFRGVKPGAGYRVRAGKARSAPFTVLPNRSAPPSTRIYNQRIPASGYGYLTTRDGTKLAIDVRLPAGPGPYPTLVEYAGYGYANPKGAESGISPIANLLGFAVVDVNMRGTGCSGGAFDYFEPLQGLDGYDVVETVARQPWVLHHRVGMLGISYGGISQLFVAATNPPHLAGITPLSVIDNTATTLYPGGILNTGFALSWAKDRVHDARPASATGGQRWALQRIQQGDTTCKANQALHGEAVNLIAKIRRNAYYVPKVADPLSPITFVHRIKAPVYMACQWTDEQTGGHCADLAEHFTGTRRKWFTFTNGTHIDSLDPVTFNRWYDFLELYVAQQAPKLTAGEKGLAPTVFSAAMGIPGVTLPDDPIQLEPSYAAALRAFNGLLPVRILFDNGAGGNAPGTPLPRFEQSFPRFPLPGTRARSWYLGGAGALTDARPRGSGADSFNPSASARPPTDFTGDTASGPGGLWTATPHYDWRQNPAGTALSYVSAPLRSTTVVVGAGALQVWLRSSVRDADLQATVSEVRPDGHETFVQSGWLRASRRKLDPRKSTLLEPVPSFTRRDASPLPAHRFVKVTIPLYYEGHAYRAGSRIRVTLAAPGGDQPVWSFSQTLPRGRALLSVARSARMPSRLLLPVVPGVRVPTSLPPCPGLRGEPCRTYQAFVNRAARVSAAATATTAAASPIPAPRSPQNPHLARDPNNNIHNDSWMTDAYNRRGPRPGTLVTQLGALPASVCGSLAFDRRGRIISVCPSSGAAPVLRMIDPKTLKVLAQYTMPLGLPSPPGTPIYQNFTGGGYFFLDQHDRVWSATKANHLFVIAETAGRPGFRKVADYDLSRAVSGDERITSALPDFQGRIWFVTKKDGKVGVLDTRTRKIHVLRTGEEIENSFAVDRDAVYIVSDRRMYRFSAGRSGRPHVDWSVTYRNSGIHKPGQVDAGSGTTPTIMPGGLVAITDNADPMNVVAYRTAKRLRPHQRRTACQVPVFGRGASATENSLIGSGRSLIVENNYGYQDPFGPTAGALTTAGFARVDIGRGGRGCRVVWTNRSVRAPSVVPKLSTKTQIVYSYTQDAGQAWSWVGMSARTGKTVFKVPAGNGLLANNNYAGIALGPDGSAYLGTIGGIRALRNR